MYMQYLLGARKNLVLTMENTLNETGKQFLHSFKFSQHNLLKVFGKLHNIHENIYFTMEKLNLFLPFFDIMMKKDHETNKF